MTSEVSIGTLSQHMTVVCPGGNVTASSITEPVPIGGGLSPISGSNNAANVIAAGDGIFGIGAGGGMTPSGIVIFPFGVGSDGNTFLMNVYGWRYVNPPATAPNGVSQGSGLWLPGILASFSTITLDSTQVGVNGTQVTGVAPSVVNYFCRAITLVTGNSGISVEVVSPGGTIHEIAHIVVQTKGVKYIECRFSTGSSATSCNAVIGTM